MKRKGKNPTTIAPDTLYVRYGKRAIDIFLSVAGLVITAPINLALAIGTRIDVGSPIVFHQERVGLNGKVFVLSKFRNMTNETDEHGELLPPEQRVTKFGKFVRKTSLDELLNFWSVLKGDMSIIGPRPLLVDYYDLWSDEHLHRLDVRPGLECPTPHKLDHPISWQEQFENDVWYAGNVSLGVDLKLAFRLVSLAFDGKQRSVRESGDKGYFIGYIDGKVVTESDIEGWREHPVFFPAQMNARSEMLSEFVGG